MGKCSKKICKMCLIHLCFCVIHATLRISVEAEFWTPHPPNHQQVQLLVRLQHLPNTYSTEPPVRSILNLHAPSPSSHSTVLLISLSLSRLPPPTPIRGLRQGLVIGFSAALPLCLPEMSDRWWPLVYIPRICCKALIYLIRGMCGEGGGACRSWMERFIMSVKHRERCTMPAEAGRVTGRGGGGAFES